MNKTLLTSSRESIDSVEEFPRTLVLSSEFPQTIHAGCITVYRLLRHYPVEKLLVIAPKTDPGAKKLDCRYEELWLPLERLNVTRFAAMKRSLDALGLFPHVPLRAIRCLIGSFTPEVIVSVMEGAYSEAAARLARATGCPLVLIVHDKQELFDRVYPWAQRAQIRANAAIYRTATRRLCVSPEMEQHLHGLYGVRGEVLYPNRSEAVTARPIERSMKLVEPPLLRVGYAGMMGYGYGTQIIRLARTLRGTKIRLRVYGNAAAALTALGELHDVVEGCGFAATPEQTWEKVKAECDVVILPYAWEADSSPVELYRTHFPGKLCEYLGLGMPVIVMGPDYATGVKWALRNPEAAVSITEDQPMKWLAAMEEIRTSPERRVGLANGALAAGHRDLNPASIRQRFMDILRDVASSSSGNSFRRKEPERVCGTGAGSSRSMSVR